MSAKNQILRKYEHPLQRLFGTVWDENLPTLEERLGDSQLSLYEDDKSIYVEASLPGLTPEEIEVTLETKVLWIRGAKKETQDNKKYHYRARKAYSFKIVLPEAVDDQKDPETKYEHGILTLVFPKTKGESPRKISIK